SRKNSLLCCDSCCPVVSRLRQPAGPKVFTIQETFGPRGVAWSGDPCLNRGRETMPQQRPYLIMLINMIKDGLLDPRAGMIREGLSGGCCLCAPVSRYSAVMA